MYVNNKNDEFSFLMNHIFFIQVLIRVHAAGVNPVDTYIRSGTYSRRPNLPYIPGLDSAGIIERVGSDVTRFKVLVLMNIFSNLI